MLKKNRESIFLIPCNICTKLKFLSKLQLNCSIRLRNNLELLVLEFLEI